MAANSPIWKGLPPGTLSETPESGKLKLAERISYTQQFAGRYGDALIIAAGHPRGSIWTILFNGAPNLFCVDNTSLDLQKGGKGVVTIAYTYLGVMPPDDFALEPAEINPPIERNPYFAALTQNDLDLAHHAFKSATADGKITIDGAIAASPNKVLIVSLVQKWLRGEKTYYLASYKFKHTLHTFNAPDAHPGGVIQQPFGAFAGYVAGSGLHWLRQADNVEWTNGLWKLTRTWYGAPSGHWDPDLYPAG